MVIDADRSGRAGGMRSYQYVEALLQRTGARSRVQLAAWGALQQQQAQYTAVLRVLEGLQTLPAGDLPTTLTAAMQLVAAGFAADKADAFLFQAAEQRLVALGTGQTPMGQR